MRRNDSCAGLILLAVLLVSCCGPSLLAFQGRRAWLLLAVPLGIALLATAFAEVRRAERKRNGICLACGYDLRASPDRCPECGTARRDDERP